MPYVTDAELAEIVPDLRALAAVEASAEIRAALIRLADRYASMAAPPISAPAGSSAARAPSARNEALRARRSGIL